MSTEQTTTLQTVVSPSVKNESMEVTPTLAVPPISSLAPSNIPPVMTWNSYVGLSNHTASQTISLNPAGEAVHRNYTSGFHTSAPVYGSESAVENPVCTDQTSIRHSHTRLDIERQVRSPHSETVRNNPPHSLPSTVHLIDPSVINTVHSTAVHPQIVTTDRLHMQGEGEAMMTVNIDASKLQEMQSVIGPNAHLSVVHHPTHHILTPQDNHAVQQTIAAYSLVTHAPTLENQHQNIAVSRHVIPVNQSAIGALPISQPQQVSIVQGPTMTTRSSKANHHNLPPVVKYAKRERPQATERTRKASTKTSPKLESKVTPITSSIPGGENQVRVDASVSVKVKYAPSKLKRKAYCIKEKLRTVERVKAGESRSKVLRDMGIPDSTLRGWIKDEEKLRTFAFNVDVKKKKARTAKDTLLDSVLYSWFLQQRDRGLNVSGSMLKTKADELNKDINGENNFKASAGWLYRFQKRHNLGKPKEGEVEEDVPAVNKENSDEMLHFPYDQGSRNQESVGCDANVAQFCQKLKEYISAGGYREEQLYTCDETGFFYKLLPDNNLLVPSDEPNCNSSKRIRDRITILFCANKTGNHKLKPLCIGKYRSPRGFQHVNINKLPFWYKYSQNACTTPTIFKDWFLTYFISEVHQHLKDLKIEEKALLLVKENAAHPAGDYLTSPTNNIRVLFLPKESASLLQPFEQDVFATFKSNYRQELIKEVNASTNNVKLYLRNLSLKTMMMLGDKSWMAITPQLIERSWLKSLPKVFDGVVDTSGSIAEFNFKDKTESVKVFQAKLEASGIETSLNTIEAWSTLNEHLPVADLDGRDDHSAEDDNTEVAKPATRELSDDENQTKVPSNAEAVKAFEIGLQWLESKNIDYITILQVQSILDYARYERRNELSQLNNC